MSYPLIGSHRMGYDVDGCAVGYRYMTGAGSALNILNQGVESWLASVEMGKLNGETRQQAWGGTSIVSPGFALWFFFPELREVTHMGILWTDKEQSYTEFVFQGSNDTSDGVDGTWETAILGEHNVSIDLYNWRKVITVSFSGPMKVVRLGYYRSTGSSIVSAEINAFHLYGSKAAGQTPDDIVFCDPSNVELTQLKNYGDTPEGTTEIYSFKVKNTSLTKFANGVNLQLNHADYGISFSADGPWATYVDISSISPESVSAPVYIKRSLDPPPLVLGPRSARVIATVGSWV